MKRYIIIPVLLVVSAAFIVSAATGGGGTPVGTPFDSGQSSFGVDGPDGQPVICANGKELRVPLSLLRTLPSEHGKAALAKQKPAQMLVWRCGTGEDPDKNPRLIDKAADPLANPKGERGSSVDPSPPVSHTRAAPTGRIVSVDRDRVLAGRSGSSAARRRRRARHLPQSRLKA